jgi:hypothetical protein
VPVSDTVPRATVEALAKNIRELQDLHKRKAATQAELIRWCIRGLQQTTDQASRALEAALNRDIREGRRRPIARVGMAEPAKKVRDDKLLAVLYLAWLATELENQSTERQIPCI